jgi:hypothetical protein
VSGSQVERALTDALLRACPPDAATTAAVVEGVPFVRASRADGGRVDLVRPGPAVTGYLEF